MDALFHPWSRRTGLHGEQPFSPRAQSSKCVTLLERVMSCPLWNEEGVMQFKLTLWDMTVYTNFCCYTVWRLLEAISRKTWSALLSCGPAARNCASDIFFVTVVSLGNFLTFTVWSWPCFIRLSPVWAAEPRLAGRPFDNKEEVG